MADAIKILVLAPYPKGNGGGAEVLLGYLEPILQRLGAVVVFRTWKDADLGWVGARIVRAVPMLSSWFRTKRLEGYPDFDGFDLVISVELMGIGIRHPRHLHLFLGSYAGFRIKAIRSAGCMRFLINRMLIALSGWLERRAGRQGALALCEALRDELESRGVRVYRETILPPTDTDRFSPGSQADARRRQKLPTGTRLALFAGRWEYAKGNDRLRAIANSLPEGWLLLVASPKPEGFQDEDGARILFRFDTAHVDMPDIYRSADIFLLPSRFEGYPMVVCEAQACGCPVVTCVDGAIRLFRQAGIPFSLGVIDSPDDPGCWIKAIEALSHPDIYADVCARSRRFVMETSSLPVVTGQYHRFFIEKFSDISWCLRPGETVADEGASGQASV